MKAESQLNRVEENSYLLSKYSHMLENALFYDKKAQLLE
jgi:hypothetical protein